jgi:hypothetical protein
MSPIPSSVPTLPPTVIRYQQRNSEIAISRTKLEFLRQRDGWDRLRIHNYRLDLIALRQDLFELVSGRLIVTMDDEDRRIHVRRDHNLTVSTASSKSGSLF